MRNSLAQRMGIHERIIKREPPKKRLRFASLPLDVSDFIIEDIVKEFAEPIYSNFYELKDGRTAVFEFEIPEVMDQIVEKYNGHEINGAKIVVEIFEQHRKQNNRGHSSGGRRSDRGATGSHYRQNVEKPARVQREDRKNTPVSVEDLDAELDAYMNAGK